MPGIVKVKVLEGRNLPVMDKSADTTDAYVEIKLGNITYKTDVCRKSLNPQWNSEWYKFEMDDAELQDEPLQVRLMDHDTYSANDMIGKVYFNLNPLLLNTSTEAHDNLLKSSHSSSSGSGSISGWFPVYDTIHGLRGEINLVIKIELFSDFNKFRQSSCGIHIFSCSMIPYGYYTENIYGLVEELVVEEDPEYQWIEKIRTPRASNEARQTMFYKMSGEVQRKIGLKAIELGGNAVIGYRQYFDLESETGGVVVRGIGTAVRLNKSKEAETQYRMSIQTDLKFKIPTLTITGAFPNNSLSDNCSVISLSESLRSNFTSEIAPEDTWSLCSFGSQTSCNSRYTSIETLLDQKNRKPILKTGSKLLSVAKYFTTSKMRRKFSRKNKQKSLQALRKFSVIEECKQKSSGNLEFEIDEMIRESCKNEPASRCDSYAEERMTRSVERIPSVEEYVSCQIYDNETSTRSMYFNVTDQRVDLKPSVAKINPEEELIFHFETNSDKPSEEKETGREPSETRMIQNLDECIVCDEPIKDSSSVNSLQLAFENNDCFVETLDGIVRYSDHYERSSPVRSVKNTRARCKTPPLSEMSPVSMTPPQREASPVRKFISEQNITTMQSLEFDKHFLRNLRRKHIDYYPLSASPEIRKLINLNETLRRSKSDSVLRTIKETDDCYDLLNDLDEIYAVSTSLSSTADVEPVFEELISPTPSDICYNNTDHIVSNQNDLGVEITTADIICNISPEALTPSCLLMHANNLDRNVSECDKEYDEGSLNPIKREIVPPADTLAKKRPSLPDTSLFTKSIDSRDNVIVDSEAASTSKPSSNRGANVIHRENFELMEYPFLTLSIYPEDFIIHLGGTVSSRSVKLLRVTNTEEPETRDAWWTELRIEIKSHMRALACNVVLNYTETTSICDEVCVLSACGTAALVKIYDASTSSLMDNFALRNPVNKSIDAESENKERLPSVSEKPSCEEINCSVYHIPYRKSSLPLPVKIKSCGICKKGYVSDVIFVTIEPFDRMPVIGQGAFIHAFVYRLKRDCKSELNAREISDGLPFLEYELNRQLVNKLRIKGMNALFGLNVQVSIGEKMISAYATGTAVLLAVLPAPPELTVSMGRPLTQNSASKKKLTDARKLLEDTIKKNRIHYQLGDFHLNISEGTAKAQSVSSTDPSLEQQYPDLEYFAGSKQTCAIEVDDEEDLEIIAQLIDPNPPQGFLVSATEKLIFGSLPYVPKKNIQLFTQVYRYRIPSNTPPSSFNKLFYRIVQGLYMKIHNRIPCSLNKVSFKMDIPEPDELQIRIVGMALALKESEKALESVSTSCSSFSELSDDLILSSNTEKDLEPLDGLSSYTPRKQITKKRNETLDNETHITSLSYIPGASINLYLGNLNFVFIRESTMVREQTGGVNNFVNSLLSDVTSIVKSHAAGIGGNAVVNFFVNECLLSTHSHKNQGQCLINVGGDVVRYSPRIYRSEV